MRELVPGAFWRRKSKRPTSSNGEGWGDPRAHLQAVSGTLALSHPGYLGVTQSTRTLFQNWVPLLEKDVRTSRRRRNLADAIRASSVDRIVFSGFADGYAELIASLARGGAGPRVFVLWHGSELQNAEDCNWKHFCQILDLAESGRIHRVGFMKEGMAELIGRSRKLRTSFVMNRVDHVPSEPGTPRSDDRVHLGFFCAGESWRKNPYAMLAAVALVKDASLSGILDDRSRRWCEMLGVVTDRVRSSIMKHEELLEELAHMHCNLYVTLSECSPLIPLESLSRGVPCLVSPTSHLFRGHSLLEEKLIVARYDESQEIARCIDAAVECRHEVVEAYARYAPEYNEKSRRSVLEFIES